MNTKENISYEYEDRVMIDKNQYLTVLHFYKLNQFQNKKIININYYFDTPDYQLTSTHKVLRIREIDKRNYELTLKIQVKNGCKEINFPLTSKQKKTIIINYSHPNNNFKEEMDKINVNGTAIKYITKLKTKRYEFYYDNYVVVIDKNYYKNKIDYNIEVESDSEIHAKQKILEICSKFNIEYNEHYINKAKRAILDL